MDESSAEGVLLGLACGDALGRPVEFQPAGQIAASHGELDEMIGDGTWGQPAGTITDDTEQALCIARSVADLGAFDPADVAERFVAWFETDPFDVGGMTRRSLQALQDGQTWEQAGALVWESSGEGSNAGNGSAMRCPPLAIAFADDPATLALYSRRSSRITHADPRCTYGCAVLNCTIAGLLRGDDEPLATALDRVRADAPDELVDALEPIANGDSPAELRTSGYVVHSLQTALHDGLTADGATDAVVDAVNRGGDTDTIGAIAGAVAGARFGADDLPERWCSAIDERDELVDLDGRLRSLEA